MDKLLFSPTEICRCAQFLAFALSAVMVTFTACSKDDKDATDVVPTAITLSATTIEVEVGGSVTLAAAVTPSNATGTVAWVSEDTSIATVDNGVVTGVAEGTTTVVAAIGSLTAQCAVTVTQGTSGSEDSSLEGSNYYLITMDDISAAKIADKIIADFRPNETTNFLYIWDNTYTAGTCSGPNSYGEVADWVSLVVSTVGWSGAGFNAQDLALLNTLSAVSDSPEDYYLHVAIKSRTATSHLLGIDGTQGKSAVCLGPSSFTDNGITYQPYANVTSDGEWNRFDIPMTYFTEQGLVFRDDNTAALNILWVLSGGTSGVTLDLDAVFIYKK